MPKGYHTVTPYMVAQDAPALIEFVKQTFGGEETFRSIGSAGGIHAEVRVGRLDAHDRRRRARSLLAR